MHVHCIQLPRELDTGGNISVKKGVSTDIISSSVDICSMSPHFTAFVLGGHHRQPGHDDALSYLPAMQQPGLDADLTPATHRQPGKVAAFYKCRVVRNWNWNLNHNLNIRVLRSEI